MGRLTAIVEGISEGTGRLARTINAWHGSPHDFDQFKMSQIGTGEGAQAYGHGLYFAGNKNVAKGYKEALSAPSNTDLFDNWFNTDALMDGARDAGVISNKGEARAIMKDHLTESLSDAGVEFDEISGIADNLLDNDAVLQSYMDLSNQYAKGADINFNDLQLAEDRFRSAAKKDVNNIQAIASQKQFDNAGSLYNVNIDATPDELLDWDLPLSEQPEAVRTKLLKLSEIHPGLFDQDGIKILKGDTEGATHFGELWGDMTGNQLHGKLEDVSSRYPGTDFGDPSSPSAVASTLNDIGIKGIQYDDAMSRGAEGGTKNYVIFDDKLIDIAKKYGVTLPVAATMMQTEEAEAGVVSKTAGKLSDLAMDTASRMKRAKEQGFDTSQTYYHGSMADIPAFDNNYFGRSDTGWHGRGTYATTDAEFAGKYAGYQQSPIDPDMPELGTEPWGRSEDKMLEQWNKQGKSPNVTPVMVRGNVVETTKLSDKIENYSDADALSVTYPDGHHEIVIKDPKNIRSVNAAFDPAKRESSNLLAGIGALGVTAALYTPEQNKAMSSQLVGMGIEDYGSITADEYPLLHQAGDFIQQYSDTPIGPLFEGSADYLRNFGTERSAWDRYKDSFGAYMDFL